MQVQLVQPRRVVLGQEVARVLARVLPAHGGEARRAEVGEVPAERARRGFVLGRHVILSDIK